MFSLNVGFMVPGWLPCLEGLGLNSSPHRLLLGLGFLAGPIRGQDKERPPYEAQQRTKNPKTASSGPNPTFSLESLLYNQRLRVYGLGGLVADSSMMLNLTMPRPQLEVVY